MQKISPIAQKLSEKRTFAQHTLSKISIWDKTLDLIISADFWDRGSIFFMQALFYEFYKSSLATHGLRDLCLG